MGSSQQFSLRWNNYLKHITCAFDTLRTDEDLVDVTLSCEGKRIRAHKMLLSACSTYFRDLFKENPCQHPVIIFRNVKFDDLAALVDFMYQGEVNVVQEQLASFLTTAELLAVQGLTDGTGKDNDSLVEDDIEIPNEPEVQLQNTSGKSTGDSKRNKSPSSPMPYHAIELQPEVPPNKRRKTRDSTNANTEKNSAGNNAKDPDGKTLENQSGSDPVEIIPLMPNLKLEMPEYLEQDGSSCSYEDQSIGDNTLNKITIDDTSSNTPDHEQKPDISQTFYSSQSTSDGLDGKHQDVGHLLSKPSTSGERVTPEALQESLKDLVIYLTRCSPTAYMRDHYISPNRTVTWNISHHKIKKKKGPARKVKRPCKKCFENNVFVFNKSLDVTTYCDDCVDKPHLCLRCFNIIHQIDD